jgi:phenylacetate-coenzyme A ligase PaaK-like adenylate-forming protein
VEGVVRAFPELADEFRIEISTDDRKGTDLVTVVAETASGEAEGVQERLRRALAQSLGVTPELRLVRVGTLERTVFKARRVVDLRRST